MPRLADVVTSDPPRLLLVGINPGLRSWALGHHFAGNGNPFWRLLYASRLVPEPIDFVDAARLATFGVALTNLCPRQTRTAAELGAAEIDRGRRVLGAKIRRWKPAVVAFVGVSLYQTYFKHPASGGPGEKPDLIGTSRVFVVPNPSGLNASFPGFEDKLVWFTALRKFVDRVAPRQARASGPPPERRPSRRRAGAGRSTTTSDRS
jgi:TDG/mug DNA glycosylase family protein